MNISVAFKNILESLRTTAGLSDAIKKILWLYRLGGPKLNIMFDYAGPLRKTRLSVRNNNGADVFIVSEVFQHECYHLAFENKIKYIMDLGANAGFTTIYFSRIFPGASFVCVEPIPENIAALKRNLQLNKLNAVVFEAAAAVRDGSIMMDIGDLDYGNKVHDIPYGKQIGKRTILVNGLTITNICRQLQWERIDVLKIDIEGYEGILLNENNAWLNLVGTIIMEIHEGIEIKHIKDILIMFHFNNHLYRRGNWIFSKTKII